MKYVNLSILAVLIGFIVFIMTRHVQASSELAPLIYIMFAISVIYGVLFVMPIGGADMPVVISLLNSLRVWLPRWEAFFITTRLC